MINYSYYNNNFKKTILLIHGWGVDSSYMESLKDFLIKDFNVLLIDLPGHGKSILEKEFTIEDYVENIHFIVEKENITNLYIIGHSFGGKIGGFYALKYRVEGEILISPSLIKPRVSIKKIIKVFLYKLLKKLHLPIPLFLKGSRDYKRTKGLVRKTFLNVVNSYLSKIELNKINTSIILIGFNNDKEVRIYQMKKLNKYLKNSKLFIYEGDHFSYFSYFKEIRVLLNLIGSEI